MASRQYRVQIVVACFIAIVAMPPIVRAAPLSGAIYTTDIQCAGVNQNIYTDRGDVYLNGGPAHLGAAGLPDGSYYVKITEPDGTALGTSVGSGNPTPVVVSSGQFASCYQLSSILIKNSDSTGGYDETTNPGGEYKVWVSNDSSFINDSSKTDNFKVKTSATTAALHVVKFYDTNVNGTEDSGELELAGWRFKINESLPGSVLEFVRDSQVNLILEPGEYVVNEYQPIQTNWRPTNYLTGAVGVLVSGQDTTVKFGNVCLGAGGGLTLGFWSNKNGQTAQFGTAAAATSTLSLLSALNLRNADGSAFDPTTYAQFRTWILGATATNMATMLSAQLAATELNVLKGNVIGGSFVYAPGVGTGAGFITINALRTAANTELGLHGLVLSGSPYRAYQEALKTALDKSNNDQNFVQSAPCGFAFP